MKFNFRVGRGVQNDPPKGTKKRVKIKDKVGSKIVENCRTSFMDVPFFSMLMDVICVKASLDPPAPSRCNVVRKEVQIVYRLFLVNCYLLHVPRLPSQPASTGGRLSD